MKHARSIFLLSSNTKGTRKEVKRGSEFKVKETKVVRERRKKKKGNQCGYPSVLRHKASSASPWVLFSWDTLHLSLLPSLTITVWFLMCGMKSVKIEEKCDNFSRSWNRDLLGFHSKGPVFEELALCKERTFFQLYYFHRYLVLLWVFGCWGFCLFVFPGHHSSFQG